ncbi:hypothetical protein [Nocardiopsis deserti]|uniref:hypothetical protein n=1 Tax=Nocardiopsis deserti TaxID=2605988 RepID=UPI001239BFEE|nr:hypothetical protein [Nocardiopsis deserti]
MTEGKLPVGSGSSVRVSLSLPEGTAEAVRAITGKREFSAYITEAVEHRLRSDLIAQDLADYQEEYGAFTEEERAWAKAELAGEQKDARDSGEAV